MKIKKRGVGTNKKAEGPMGMSFGMIFSIILMVFFVIVAFMVIKQFMHTRDCLKVGMFSDDFQTEIDKVWNSQSNSFIFESQIPSGIEYICFANLSSRFRGENEEIGNALEIYELNNGNVFLYPSGKSCEMPYFNIKHLDIKKIVQTENPYCIKVDDGKASFIIKKEFNQRLVGVSRN